MVSDASGLGQNGHQLTDDAMSRASSTYRNDSLITDSHFRFEFCWPGSGQVVFTYPPPISSLALDRDQLKARHRRCDVWVPLRFAVLAIRSEPAGVSLPEYRASFPHQVRP